MPPNVALTIGVTFSLVLLVYDVRRRTGVSAAVWLPTTLLMIIASRSFAQWGADPLEMGPQSGYQSSLVDVAFFFAVIVGSATVVTARKIKWTRLFIGNIGITLCYFYFGLSVLWSEDPIGSLKRWFKVFGLLAAVAVVLSEESPEEAIRALHVRCASVLLPLSVVLNKYFPNLARAYSPSGELLLSGVATQKNSLGQIAMILILFLVWDILETVSSSTKRHLPWDLVVLLFTGMYLLSASESKTSLVCVIVGAALLMRGKRLASAPVNSAVLLASLAMPCFMALTQAFSSFISPLTEMLGRDMTFTGRTPIWEAILAEGVVDPFFGAGYFNFWASTGAERVRAFVHAPGIHSAHNGYLDIFLDGGLIGVILLFGLLLIQGRRLTKNVTASRYQRLRLACLIVLIIYNLSESTFVRLVPLWFTGLLVMVDPAFIVRRPPAFQGRANAVTLTASTRVAKYDAVGNGSVALGRPL